VDELHSKWSPLCTCFGMVFVHSVKLMRLIQPLDPPNLCYEANFWNKSTVNLVMRSSENSLRYFWRNWKLLFAHRVYLYFSYVSHN
jgi:hypothetical protein